MKLPAELIEIALQLGCIKIQLARQSEERKVIRRLSRLQLATRIAEVRFQHLAARPARSFRTDLRQLHCTFAVLLSYRHIPSLHNTARLLRRAAPISRARNVRAWIANN